MKINPRRAKIGNSYNDRGHIIEGRWRDTRPFTGNLFKETDLESKYFYCTDDKICSEIKNMNCKRTCNNTEFIIPPKATVILSNEDIVIAQCPANNDEISSSQNSIPNIQNVIMKCSMQEIISNENGLSNINLGDCIDGRKLDETHFQTSWKREDLMKFSANINKNGLNHLIRCCLQKYIFQDMTRVSSFGKYTIMEHFLGGIVPLRYIRLTQMERVKNTNILL